MQEGKKGSGPSSYEYAEFRDSCMSGREINQGVEETMDSSIPGRELSKVDIGGTVLEE